MAKTEPYALPCKGVTYVSVGRAEPEDPLQQVAECDDIPGCGWSVVMAEHQGTYAPEGTWDVTVTSDEFLPLHAAHITHRHRNDPDPHPEDCQGCQSWEADLHNYLPAVSTGERRG